MKRAAIVTVALLAGALAAQAAPHKAPRRVAHVNHVSACVARQRAMLAPLDRYGGNLPPNVPAFAQAMIAPVLHTIRTRCLPRYNGPPDVSVTAPDDPPAATAPIPVPSIDPPYQPSANNPACPGSIC
jgi:hypothetical protein